MTNEADFGRPRSAIQNSIVTDATLKLREV